ncbi:MAG: NAD-dependent epimerase/dehydratase family protein [Planctomycetota bacterium]|nr:MAG: NAD-dependent epimerase/dehydratase family protein [Planctomycetota bacterium]
MARALVTGGGGFLGRALCLQLLAAGDEVAVFSRRRFPDLEERGVESLQGDLADAKAVRAACAGREVVYHVAALAGAWGDPARYEATNVIGTRNVIAACRAGGVPKLVFTSSPSVVAPPTPHDLIDADESTPYPERTLADYPRTKALAERDVLAANDRKLATCALRPHLILGPGDPHLLPRVFARARAGRLRIVGAGTNLVDFTYVEDAARAHRLAAACLDPGGPAAGRAYFITQGEPVALWPWINGLLEAVGLPPVTRRISLRGAMRLGGALEATWRWLRLSGEPPMTRFVALQLATTHTFSIAAARRDLRYEPSLSMDELTALLAEHYGRGPGRAVAHGG